MSDLLICDSTSTHFAKCLAEIQEVAGIRLFFLQERCTGKIERSQGGCESKAYWIPDPKPHPDYETYVQMYLVVEWPLFVL